MAEAWLEEEEEELRELRDNAGNRRNRRANLNPATDRSERNKPEHRFSGQGALSSIRAVIKRTSRTTTQSEQQRERRRPEITIVAAEPLGPAWFPSSSHGASGGLAYPPPASQWRNEPVPAELPPSYEQVIKEINRVQVNTPTNNNAAPRLTTTSATQTDFQEEAALCPPDCDVNHCVLCEPQPIPEVHFPPKPPRPSVSPLTSNLEELVPPLTPEQQSSQGDPSFERCPVPRPRSKSNLRPVVADSEQQEVQDELYQPSARRDPSPEHFKTPFEDNFFEDQVLKDSMSTGSSQSSIVSRIKAFESQKGIESSGLPRKPEIAPRSLAPKPAVPAGKPMPAPKPLSSRASGEWSSWTESKPQAVFRELPPLLPKTQETGTSALSKPELPKKPKPKPSLVKGELLDSGSGFALENSNNDGERKVPVPAPRPLLPKKTFATENPASWTAALKPVSAAPRLSVATQAKAFASLGAETTANNSTPALQSRTANEWDLISFDDDIAPVPSAAVESKNPEAPAEVQFPPKPPRPSVSPLTSNLEEFVPPLTPEQQSSQGDPSFERCPVPRPRSKSNLRPVVADSEQQEVQDELYQPSARRDPSPEHFKTPFEDNFFEDQVLKDSMSTGSSQSSIVSRIKAFESQKGIESSGLPRKPEIAPRSLAPKPAVPAGKPTPAPKPLSSRASGEWSSWTESKPQAAFRELPPLLPKTQETGTSALSKPELPKKPKPSLVKGELLDSGSGFALENSNNDGERKVPVPAPRPLLPKKTFATENPASWTAALKPVSAAPRLSVATQAKAFASLGAETTANNSTPALQSRTANEWDLISFDDDIAPVPSAAVESKNPEAPADPFLLVSKPEQSKEQPAAPALLRKPTVIRIPSKPIKTLSEDLQVPPPLPTEKPIGIFHSDAGGKPSNPGRTGSREPEHQDWSDRAWAQPALPSRPAGGKVIPARPPVQKGAPGRPPPPKVSSSKTTAQKEPFHRSSSDVGLDMKLAKSGMKRSKSQLLRKQEPELPPRPKPGHQLYNKYMLPVPHAIAQRDSHSRNPQELSCKRGDVLVLVERVDSNHFQCQKGEESGEVHVSKMKIITPLENRRKDQNSTHRDGDSYTPHALVMHDFPAEEADDLSLPSGEIVQLLEKIDHEWYRGQYKGRTGIFPASYVNVIVDVPEPDNAKRTPPSSDSVMGPRCKARFEFIGDQDGELSFEEGQIICLKEYVNEEWAKGEINRQTGIFPLNFVEVVEDLPSCGQSTPTVSGSGAQLKSKRPNSGSGSQPNRSSGEWCEALYDFTAETGEDLPFRRGDRILIIERLDSEWYRGRLNDREGILPAAFVQPSTDVPKSSSQPQGQEKSRARALYDFCGENEDELTFKVGDLITVLKYIDGDWMSGELQGRSGMFPRNFVQVL